MTRIGWFHCLAGASGDMVLGALVDAGVPLETLQDAVDAVGVEATKLEAEPVERHGLGATKVTVRVTRSSVVRTWPHIRGLIEQADLAEPVRRVALDVFGRLAAAEAAVHHTNPDLVHFHEIGGLDAIADIVGAAAGLHALGLDEVHASAVATGLGMTRGDHGLLPIPTPAVVHLLEGAPIYSGGVAHELCTPTGAALLAATVRTWGELPTLVVERVGMGAGDRDLDELPNVLRLVVGSALPVAGAGLAASSTDASIVVSANVDDLDPRLWPGVITALMSAGAVDAWLTPIHMKKGRPAVEVSALTAPSTVDAVRGVLFRETSTIGVREHAVAKHVLDRAVVTVAVAGGDVRVKVARLGGRVVNAVPEFEDVAALAAREGRPVKDVLAAANAAAQLLRDDDESS